MKKYNIIDMDGKSICYRIYGTKYGYGVEVINGIDPVKDEKAKQFYSWWHFHPEAEARRIYRLAFGDKGNKRKEAKANEIQESGGAGGGLKNDG